MMRSILHLNGWQRIGIVASIFWIVGSGFTVRKTETAHAMRVYGSAYGRCLKIEGIQQLMTIRVALERLMQPIKTELKLTGSWARVAVLSSERCLSLGPSLTCSSALGNGEARLRNRISTLKAPLPKPGLTIFSRAVLIIGCTGGALCRSYVTVRPEHGGRPSQIHSIHFRRA